MNTTKTYLLMLFALFTNCAGFASGAAPLAGQTIDGRFYVEPGTVYVGANGIFLNIESNFIPVEGVCLDEYGIYAIGYDAMRMVTCSRCGKSYNADRFSDRCPHTGEKVHYSS